MSPGHSNGRQGSEHLVVCSEHITPSADINKEYLVLGTFEN